jgi:hypothetical protein
MHSTLPQILDPRRTNTNPNTNRDTTLRASQLRTDRQTTLDDRVRRRVAFQRRLSYPTPTTTWITVDGFAEIEKNVFLVGGDHGDVCGAVRAG